MTTAPATIPEEPATAQAPLKLVQPGTRYTDDTEALLIELEQVHKRGLEAHYQACEIMLKLIERPEFQGDHNGMTAAIHERWKGALSHVWISAHWGVAHRLVRHIGLGGMLAAGFAEFDVAVQASVWAGNQRRKPGQAFSPAQLAARALEEFSTLNRDEARAKRDPGSTAKLDTRPEQNAATDQGLFPVETVRRHASADRAAHEKLNAVLEKQQESPLTPTLHMEFWAALKTSFGEETLAALKRLHESGASGLLGSHLLACYLLSEIGCEPAALRAIGEWLNRPHAERTADNLKSDLERNQNPAVEGEPS